MNDSEWSKWPFERSELTAALRRRLGRPDLQVQRVWEEPVPSRPAVGHIRGLGVQAISGGEVTRHSFLLKQPKGATRAGLAGVGRREVGVYERLAAEVPLAMPTLVAAGKDGGWLIMETIPPGPPPEAWDAGQYRQAVLDLAAMHDRFWELADDLSVFQWLGRPLTVDYEVYVLAAAASFEKLVFENLMPVVTDEYERVTELSKLISQADRIAAALRRAPQTLLHGDYWPGNINAADPGRHIVFDWQLVGVGPGVIDLVSFVTKSQWWFGPLPISEHELVQLYLATIAERTRHVWDDDEWEELWDFALMWCFTTEWLDLLAASPRALLETRQENLRSIWLRPVIAAIERRLDQ